jgi:metal-responsive CopG/Arc/MetJ family transcriptional regulator
MVAQKSRPEKATREVKLRLGDELLQELRSYAAEQGFDELSPCIRKILREHIFGHRNPNRDLLSAAVRDE